MKKINTGLNLLRIVLTFGVVLDHFWMPTDPQVLDGVWKCLWQLRTLAVPAFMTMTFFLTAGRFRESDGGWLRRRFSRLLEPYVFWAAVYFAVVLLLGRFNPVYKADLGDLGLQLALGSSPVLCMQFWFHVDLMVLTAVFFALFKYVKGTGGLFAVSLFSAAAGWTLQYSGLNYQFFGWMPFEARYVLGRLSSMLPYASAGFLLAAARPAFESTQASVRVAVSAFGLWIAWFAIFRDVCPRPPSATSLGYDGVNMNLIAWGVLPAFYFLPFERLPALAERAVLFVSRYAMGVYCVHLLLGWIWFDFVAGGEARMAGPLRLTPLSLWHCLAVWVLSYLVCFLLSKIPLPFFRRVVQ